MKKIQNIAPSETSASRIVSEFLTAFLSGDHDKTASLLTSDFSFRAPLVPHGGDKTAYFAGAKEKVKYIRRFGILYQWANQNEVVTFYELEIETPKGSATMIQARDVDKVLGRIGMRFILGGVGRFARLRRAVRLRRASSESRPIWRQSSPRLCRDQQDWHQMR